MYCGDLVRIRHEIPSRKRFDQLAGEIESWLYSAPNGLCDDGKRRAWKALELFCLLYDYYEYYEDREW